ncbi:hypothetical protein EV207_15120 [Scopulibacillus darangshiensis]|uniref:TRAP transporter TAXI family solute receptor n=1 Tax=Scopulibacillus darangshiensis TaxID=442528 RepID=A0A4R2NHM4_9BACL|nr:TAXI family TRAP transporter solute-binding subunit [Scopulibacillus darangshiensis]TCP20654.1 hypothetical protein EV207_15120 [Scopulibacillus darangshiensis]
MRRLTFVMVFILVLTMSLLGCSRGGSETASSSEKNSGKSKSNGQIEINFGTGTTTGVYYPLGATLAKVWNKELSNVHVSSQSTDASVQNLNLMMQGKINMGLTTVGVLYEAYKGTGKFKDRPFKDVRVIAALYPNVGQVVTSKKTGIESVADFKGKGFVPGAPGSSTKVLSQRILAAYGLSFDDVKPQYVGFTEATDLMRNKRVAGAQIMAGIPTSAIVEIMSTANGKLVNLGDKEIKKLTDKYPWLFKYTIPAGTYDGQESDVTTVAQGNMIVVPKDMPEDTVYKLTKAMWEHIDAIRNSVSAAKNMKLDTATDGLSGIPLHQGAKKFYKEEGILK